MHAPTTWLVSALLVVLAWGCTRPTDEQPVSPAPVAPTPDGHAEREGPRAEPPPEPKTEVAGPTTPSETDPEAVAEAPPPAEPSAPIELPTVYEPPADPLAVLLTEGNRWEHAEIIGWHDELWSVAMVEQRVTAVETIGPFTVATMTVSGDTFATIRRWVRKGDALYMFEENDPDALPPLGSAAEIRAALRRRQPIFALSGAIPGLGCGMIGCAGTLLYDGDHGTVALWPGVGILERGEDGPYSEETGDGTTISTHLVRAWLPSDSPLPVIEPEPPAATKAREAALDALGRSETRRYTKVRHSLDFENRNYPAFAAALANNGPQTWSLDAVLGQPCALVRGTVDLLACPESHARWSATVGRGVAPPTSEPRAYFMRRGERFELLAVFAGGRADIFTIDDDANSVPSTEWPPP